MSITRVDSTVERIKRFEYMDHKFDATFVNRNVLTKHPYNKPCHHNEHMVWRDNL